MILVFAAGCSSAAPAPSAPTEPMVADAGITDAPPPDPSMTVVLAALVAQRDRMCACVDRACVEAAEADQFEWGFANKSVVDSAKPTPAQAQAADDLIEATEACAHRF